MITAIPLENARVLVVGDGILIDTIVTDLKAHGIRDITIMNGDGPSPSVDGKQCNFIKKNALQYIKTDSDYFKSFHLCLVANQPRAFELALSDARWPNGKDDDLPMIVMRNVENICKMRCQYGELPSAYSTLHKFGNGGDSEINPSLVNSGKSSKFVSLPMDLPPWTAAKTALIASIIKQQFYPKENPKLHAYFVAARAFIDLRDSNGSWPGEEDKEQVKSMANMPAGGDGSMSDFIEDFVKQLCKGGLSSISETITLMSRLVSLDTIKLLTGNGQPINHANLEEVIKIATSTS